MRLLATGPIFLLALACVTTPTSPGTGKGALEPVSVAFYLIHEAPAEGLVERKVERTGETIFIAPTPNLTQHDISWAKMELDYIKRRAYVLVHFSPIGREKLSTLTRQNRRKRLAIVIDGKVLSTPLIQTPIDDGRATIRGFRSPDEAQRVADSLSRR